MKYSFCIIFFCLFISCSFVTQKKEALPSFNLLLLDSTTTFNTAKIPEGKPFVLVYFSPDCEHCQQETEQILAKMDSLNKTKFYFFSVEPFGRIKAFHKYYHLSNYPNITMGRDYTFFFPIHFKANSVPWVLIYNKRKRLERVYEGGLTPTKLIQAMNEIEN